ncbi:MAG: hypothetical protein IKK85_06140 [Clostridia bacterium]|nr:hypothetical protein [Clostridia bacterium]
MKGIKNTNKKGYDFITDSETGELFGISRATGEVRKAAYIPVVEGTKCYDPESQEEYRAGKEQEQKKYLERAANLPLGGFYFTSCNESFKNISAESVTRLIYLSTFINYESNMLMKTERTPIKHNELQKLLRVSRATFYRFWEEVNPAYLTRDTEGNILINNNVFSKGATKKNFAHRKFYIKGVQKLYKSTPLSKHKQLGYLFKLLPFVNIEFNLLCWNPLETDLNEVELMSLTDFCQQIGYDIGHISRLLSIYNNIKFETTDNTVERFCSVVYDGLDRANAKIFINPHVLYSGSNYEKVEILGAFCS